MIANTMEEVVCSFTQVMPMVHVCRYNFLSLIRLVSCVGRPKFVPADCRHNGPGLALAKQCWMGTQGVTVGCEHSVQSTLN